MPCNCCEIENNTFTDAEAKANLRDYRRRGPAKQTRLILEAVRSLGLKDAALLDIGGGIGTIHHELLNDVARVATHVDASSAYLKVATEEAKRLRHEAQVKFIHADFTDVAGELPQADVVTLDRVVCCYPNFRELLKAASSKSRKAIALTYPRETWYVRIGLKAINFFQWLRNNPFRVFLHSVNEMEALLNAEGLEEVSVKQLLIWEMALYRRRRVADL
ncbi:MAG: methyltransferase domain-containing protein [Anaerolineales bacterium]|nr:methyltransferase domain-containing protein [Anaerolineales bacterium]